MEWRHRGLRRPGMGFGSGEGFADFGSCHFRGVVIVGRPGGTVVANLGVAT